MQISVLLPVYNVARYLRQALQSVLQQTFSDFEVVVVDDGSGDGSLAILREFGSADPRLRIISRPNTGIVGALNDGLEACRGEFVARMDADDVCHPARFAWQREFLASNEDCVALGSAVLFTDPANRPLKVYRPSEEHGMIVQALARGNGGALVHPSVMFRRSAILQVGGYREEYQWIEDLDLFIRLAAVGRLANLPNVLLRYRQHPKSVNHLREGAERRRRALSAVNALRASQGLDELPELAPSGASLVRVSDCRRQYAFDAATAGFIDSARWNARLALMRCPWDRRNWSCVRYVTKLPSRFPANELFSAEAGWQV